MVWWGPKGANNPDVKNIHNLLLEGKQQEAEHFVRMSMYSQPRYLHSYRLLADMYFWYLYHNGPVNHYWRDLNFETAISRVSYELTEVQYTHEYFSSAVDQVFVVRLTCDKPGGLSFSVQLMRSPFDLRTKLILSDTIMMLGECGRDGIEFFTTIKTVHEGGHVCTIGDSISVENVDSVTLYLSAATTFYYDNPEQVCLQQVEDASYKSYDMLKEAHIAEYREKFARVSFEISGSEAEKVVAITPTDSRLKHYQREQKI